MPCFNSLSFRFVAKICVMDGLRAAYWSLTSGHFEWIQVEVRTCQWYWDQRARLMTPSEDCLGICEEKWGLVRTREVGWGLVRWGRISVRGQLSWRGWIEVGRLEIEANSSLLGQGLDWGLARLIGVCREKPGSRKKEGCTKLVNIDRRVWLLWIEMKA